MKYLSGAFRTTLLSSILAAGFAAHTAVAAPLFTVDESAINGVAGLVTADRLSFDYKAQIVQTVVGGSLDGAGDTFIETGFLSNGAFSSPTSGSVPSHLNSSGAGGYGLYATFTITGEGDPFGATGGILATFSSLSMTLYADPTHNTVLAIGGATSGAGDDFALANYTLQVGQAHVFGGLANGDFDTLLNTTLTAAGQAYFISPTPFFSTENFGGNTQTFNITSGSTSTGFTASAAGGGIELFIASSVPEPETYALMLAGLGLVGSIARRRARV